MRAGIVLALVVASVAALLFFDLASKATANLRGHYAPHTRDVEAAALGGGERVSSFHNHSSSLRLTRVWEGAL